MKSNPRSFQIVLLRPTNTPLEAALNSPATPKRTFALCPAPARVLLKPTLCSQTHSQLDFDVSVAHVPLPSTSFSSSILSRLEPAKYQPGFTGRIQLFNYHHQGPLSKEECIATAVAFTLQTIDISAMNIQCPTASEARESFFFSLAEQSGF